MVKLLKKRFIILLIYLVHSKFQWTETSKDLVGEINCRIENYPFMISLRNSVSLTHFCGGTLIKPDWVLTAGHCIQKHFLNLPEMVTAVGGTSQLHLNGSQKTEAKEILVHPNFDSDSLNYDVSLVKLTKSFNLSYTINLVHLPQEHLKKELVQEFKTGKVVGWRFQELWDPKSEDYVDYNFDPTLQCTDLPIITNEDCVLLREGHSLEETKACAYHREGGYDDSRADSGGPLLCNNTQYGIVSSYYESALPNDLEYFTRVDELLDYIKQVTKNNSVGTFQGQINLLELGLLFVLVISILTLFVN